MSIWHTPPNMELVNQFSEGCMVAHLGIEITDIGDNYLCGKMPVDHRTKQPFGLLHGGASVTLAETLGSIASGLVVDVTQKKCVGLEINANHLRSATSGWVYGTARPIHIGQNSHIWDIQITNHQNKLVCISRLTMAVI
ncbi:MAG: hotdog fold thioesterase [Sphingobacteriales bacterium]|nr:hotdog fold thioesterase [Sphingobacteriales bacterium]